MLAKSFTKSDPKLLCFENKYQPSNDVKVKCKDIQNHLLQFGKLSSIGLFAQNLS